MPVTRAGVTWAGAWRLRARTAEAAAWLLAARVLVAAVPFGRWQALLGSPVAVGDLPEQDPRLTAEARRLARHVDRAANRLPLKFKCLPRAAALQFMLRRRRIAGTLLMGIVPQQQRGTLDDLHAWVVCGNTVVIGELDGAHRPILALRTDTGN